MSSVLLVYATREGQTEKVAERIAGYLRDRGDNARVLNAADAAIRQMTLEGFDQLVFGASMHAGGLEKEIVTFLNERQSEIERLPRSLFVVLLSAATGDPVRRAESLADARAKIDDQLKVSFDDVEMIAGALKYSRYAWPMKWLMRRIARQEGGDTDTSRDYEYTDWKQVEAYAERLGGH